MKWAAAASRNVVVAGSLQAESTRKASAVATHGLKNPGGMPWPGVSPLPPGFNTYLPLGGMQLHKGPFCRNTMLGGI